MPDFDDDGFTRAERPRETRRFVVLNDAPVGGSDDDLLGLAGGARNAGLDDLAHFRSEDPHTGPVIFYTSEVTQSRRDRATELDATGITDNPADVLPMIAAMANGSTRKS
jgi:hypothetical protein